MTDNSYSLMLRNLAKDYYHQRLDVRDYRAQRKIILDEIDEEFNAVKVQDTTTHDSDAKEPSIFMQTIAFFKNSDIDQK